MQFILELTVMYQYYPATKTSLSLAFTPFAYSTEAKFHRLALSNTLSSRLIGIAFATPTLCLISLELNYYI